MRGLIGLGVSGGLVPCPSALVVLLAVSIYLLKEDVQRLRASAAPAIPQAVRA